MNLKHPCLSYLPVAVCHPLEKATERRGEVTASQPGVTATGAKVAGHTAPQAEKPRALDGDAWLTLPVLFSPGPSPGNGAAHNQSGLPTSMNPMKKIHHWYAHPLTT